VQLLDKRADGADDLQPARTRSNNSDGLADGVVGVVPACGVQDFAGEFVNVADLLRILGAVQEPLPVDHDVCQFDLDSSSRRVLDVDFPFRRRVVVHELDDCRVECDEWVDSIFSVCFGPLTHSLG